MGVEQGDVCTQGRCAFVDGSSVTIPAVEVDSAGVARRQQPVQTGEVAFAGEPGHDHDAAGSHLALPGGNRYRSQQAIIAVGLGTGPFHGFLVGETSGSVRVGCRVALSGSVDEIPTLSVMLDGSDSR